MNRIQKGSKLGLKLFQKLFTFTGYIKVKK